MKTHPTHGPAALALALALLLPAAAPAEERLPQKLKGITVTEKLGGSVPLNLTFTDHRGKKVQLRQFFDGTRPVMLTLNYYRCATLCSVQLNSLVRTLRKMEWTAGKNFRQLTLSIDHREGWELGQAKRKNYLESLERGEVDWSFLVGSEADIARVAGSVGFGYRYDPKLNQWAHPAVIVFLSPDGKISRYIYGLEYEPRDIKFALIDASEGKVGSTVDKLILSCFHYDADEGRYGPYAFGIMRLGGVVTVALVVLFLALLWRRERRGRKGRDEPGEDREREPPAELPRPGRDAHEQA